MAAESTTRGGVANVHESIKIPVEALNKKYNVSGARRVLIDIELVGTDSSEKAAVLEVRALDARSERVEIPQIWRKSEHFGEYEYLAVENDEGITEQRLEIDLPAGVEDLVLVGHQWGRTAAPSFVGPPIVNAEGRATTGFVSCSGRQLTLSAEYVDIELERPYDASILSVEFDFQGETVNAEAKSPLSVSFLDDRRRPLLPPGGLSVSPTLGSFLYLTGDANEITTHSTRISVPSEVTTVVLQGHKWGHKTATVIGGPRLEWETQSSFGEIEKFLDDTRDDETLIIVDTTAPPLGDESRALRPNNLVREYSKLGHRVIFFPFSTIQDQDALILPGVIQADRKHFGEVVQAAASRRGETTENIYICSSFGSVAAVATIDYLKEKGWNCMYEIRDDMEEFNRVGYSKWYSTRLERRVISRAQRIVTVSPALAQKAESMVHGSSEKTAVVPNAVRTQIIEKSKSLRVADNWNQRPVRIGYVGHLTPSWFDWRLVTKAATELRDVEFEIVGHGMPKGLHLPSNMSFLGPKTQDELLEIVAAWRVGTIPFAASPLTRGVDPNKLFEYLAWGLRVVSAPMGSVDTAPSTIIYRTFNDFTAGLRDSVNRSMTETEMDTIRTYAEANTWADRADRMIQIIREGN